MSPQQEAQGKEVKTQSLRGENITVCNDLVCPAQS